MPHHLDNREKASAAPELRAGRICLFVAALFVVLGAIGNTMNTSLILDLMPWFLVLIIAFFVTFLIGWAACRHPKTTGVKEKE
jgi:hypothetical protein